MSITVGSNVEVGSSRSFAVRLSPGSGHCALQRGNGDTFKPLNAPGPPNRHNRIQRFGACRRIPIRRHFEERIGHDLERAVFRHGSGRQDEPDRLHCHGAAVPAKLVPQVPHDLGCHLLGHAQRHGADNAGGGRRV